MSRTDKTRPVWVRMADAPMQTCVPRHDHRFGPCSLPAGVTHDADSGQGGAGACCWTENWGATAFRRSSDSREWCQLRREDRRRSRHGARRELRAWHDER